MGLRTQCRECGLGFGGTIETGGTLPCPNCGVERTVAEEGWDADAQRVERCPLCGSEHLYRQRDFNRTLGCLLIVVGIILVPWTYGLSLIVLSAVDLLIYFLLPFAAVCYKCDTVYRDARPTGRQGDFDLLKHDVVKYGKTWEDKRRKT